MGGYGWDSVGGREGGWEVGEERGREVDTH